MVGLGLIKAGGTKFFQENLMFVNHKMGFYGPVWKVVREKIMNNLAIQPVVASETPKVLDTTSKQQSNADETKPARGLDKVETSEQAMAFVRKKLEQESEQKSKQKTPDKIVEGKLDYVPANSRLSFSVDKETEQVIVKVLDAKSGELIRQIPSEEMVKLAKVLEQYKGNLVSRVL